MNRSRPLSLSQRRFLYLVCLPLAGVLVLVAVLLVWPLLSANRSLAAQIEEAGLRLAAEGFGAGREDLATEVARLQAEVERTRRLAEEQAALLDLHPLVAANRGRPFQILEFEQERLAVSTRLRQLSERHGVRLPEETAAVFPELGAAAQHPGLIWAQLALYRQVLETAVVSGVATVDRVGILPVRVVLLETDGATMVAEVRVVLEAEADLEALRRFLLQLSLPAAAVERAGLGTAAEDKIALGVDRFVIHRAHPEDPATVRARLVVSGLLRETT
ncbi:MAG: hypothetical protein EA425_01065 [Puniceicoccaceae bacterium]|nr:MAG: hypothetical protein EA425_01065 [Puniceicoccaceae bacterium]